MNLIPFVLLLQFICADESATQKTRMFLLEPMNHKYFQSASSYPIPTKGCTGRRIGRCCLGLGYIGGHLGHL